MSSFRILSVFRSSKLLSLGLIVFLSFNLILTTTAVTRTAGKGQVKIFGNQDLAQNDPRLLNYIRKHHLNPPSTVDLNSNSSERNYVWAYYAIVEKYERQIQTIPGGLQFPIFISDAPTFLILTILKSMIRGYFVEYGYDMFFEVPCSDPCPSRVRYPTTLTLERDFGWTGFIALPYKNYTADVLTNNWKVWTADFCFSTFNHSVWNDKVTVVKDKELMKSEVESKGAQVLNDRKMVTKFLKNVKKPAFPIFSVLAALNVTTVDLFVMQAIYSERDILSNVPFDKILIKIFCIRTPAHATVDFFGPVPENLNIRQQVEKLLGPKGYKLVNYHGDNMDGALLFVHESVAIPPAYQ